MDAHLFRRFCDAFVPGLPGTRLEKIHQPCPGVTVFTLYGMVRDEIAKHYLVLKAERKDPFLFVAHHRIPVNAHPPAPVMRLRKYLSGQRILEARVVWTERQLYLRVTGLETLWLVLDLRAGPSLLFADPPPFAEPAWPSDDKTCPPLETLTQGEGWRNWPVLTPALRRTLPYLDDLDAKALIMDLQAGGGDVFLYETEDKAGNPIREISAWPLPDGVLTRTKSAPGNTPAWRESVWEDIFEPLTLAGEARVYAQIAVKARDAAAKPFSAEASRLARLQKKLDKEEERLLALTAKQEHALLLQRCLYLFPADEKRASITLPQTMDTEATPTSESTPLTIALDPRLTIRENMTAMFHQAGRGKRGLAHLETRKQAVAEECRLATEAMLRSQAGAGAGATSSPNGMRKRGEQGTKALSNRKAPADLPKQVQAFRSSDGFLLLRGRDTKGNGLVLKLAAPHDFWLHTAHGPGAHVIIRRDHAGHEVPERTLREAGALAALKSRLKEAAGAEIQYSLAKYIHPMRSAGPGMVRIDRSEGSFWTDLDPALEERLKIG